MSWLAPRLCKYQPSRSNRLATLCLRVSMCMILTIQSVDVRSVNLCERDLEVSDRDISNVRSH